MFGQWLLSVSAPNKYDQPNVLFPNCILFKGQKKVTVSWHTPNRVKGTNYSRTAMCHIYVNTQYISTKFGIHVRYVNSTYCVKFELICICVTIATDILKLQRGELKNVESKKESMVSCGFMELLKFIS